MTKNWLRINCADVVFRAVSEGRIFHVSLSGTSQSVPNVDNVESAGVV
jgi:hypothetical protein